MDKPASHTADAPKFFIIQQLYSIYLKIARHNPTQKTTIFTNKKNGLSRNRFFLGELRQAISRARTIISLKEFCRSSLESDSPVIR